MSWYSAQWPYRKTISIDPAKVGSGGVAGLPVLIDFSGDAHVLANMRADANDVLFTSSDGVSKLPHDLEGSSFLAGNALFSGKNGNYPAALRVGDYTYFAFITRNLYHAVLQYSHVTGAAHTKIFRFGIEGADDHSSPCLAAYPSGRMCAFYAAHNGKMHYSVQATAGDNSAWTEFEVTNNVAGAFSFAYASAFVLPNGALYLFFRGADWRRCFLTNATEAGVLANTGWSVAQPLFHFAGERPYLRVRPAGNEFHFQVTTGNPAEIAPSIYYCRWDLANFYRADGSLVSDQTLPINVATLDRIFDSVIDGAAIYGETTPARETDLVVVDGKPSLLFYAMPPSRGASVLWCARWTGSAWARSEIAPGVRYSTLMYSSETATFDLNDARVCYWESDNGSTRTNIMRAVERDARWHIDTLITSPQYMLNRPFVVPGAIGDDLRLLYLAYVPGRYLSFSDFLVNTCCLRPPDARTAAWVRVPVVSDSATTVVYLYYGHTGAMLQSDPAATWADYAHVNHLQRTGLADLAYRDAGSGVFGLKSATPNALGHNGPVSDQAGKIRGAQLFSATQFRVIVTPVVNIAGLRAVTLSAWIRTTAASVNAISSQQLSTPSGEMWLRLASGALSGGLRKPDGVSASGTFTFSPGITLTDGLWHYIAVVFDADAVGGLRGYADGRASSNVIAYTGSIHPTATVGWGVGWSPHTTSANMMVGSIDEARIRLSGVTAAQLLAEFNNQSSAATFYAIGDLELVPSPSGYSGGLDRDSDTVA